ncbi:MAG: BREX-1 system adenine-specific DNA-methyltransferase PglX [Pseudomonadota bacterium]|nr:BREX-1 system adenine-specific DNA-methyltransferase PglX [Pseudomonadota bacterium]
MTDSALFTAGTLLNTDYLCEAIKQAPEYLGVDLSALRSRLISIADAFPKASSTNESQTEDDFIWPVLGALGWTESIRQQNLTVTGRDDVPDGVLFANAEAKAAANELGEQWKRYAHGLAVVESKRWARPLDRASGRDEATAPSTQMLRYLRRIDDLTAGQLRWGILTNGTKWRLYWAGARSVSEEFLEIDLARVLALDGNDDLFVDQATRDHWLRVFAALFCRDAFIKTGTDNRSFHERARAVAAYYEERVAASLSKLVFEQVFPDLAAAISTAAPRASLQDVRQASLVLLYRLLFLLYAEDRDLLPVGEKRYDDYALRHQRKEVGERVSDGDVFSATAGKIWAHVADLARIIDKGDASVGIPPYNGGLFAGDGTPLLDSIRIPDSIMGPVVDALSYERSSGERRYINYRDLSVQQLGSIYERLLEFEIVRDDTGALAVRPNLFARKNSGSYYTPDELVGLILDQALEPLITERLDAFRIALGKLNSQDSEDHRRRELADADPAEAILKLRICDPAMGSGHFLVSLVDTLADHVLDAMAEAAALASDVGYVSSLATKIEDIRRTILKNARHANWTIDEAQLDDRHIVRRMVLKRCVYGVDKNPMAVELAKVALWLHTFTVGAPLSFIDHHLRAGDSLFGLWVRDAIDRASSQGGELLWNEALRNAQRSAEAMKTIEALTDIEIAEAHRSAAMYEDVELMTGELDGFVSFIHGLDWLNLDRGSKSLVRLWLDGQFGDPIPIARGRKPPTPGKARPEDVEAFTAIWQRARDLIAEERFLNWQIAFPGVWDNWSSKGRVGGFDAVVGNPPWDRFEFEEVPWFEARDRSIALEPSGARRKASIRALKDGRAPLWTEFQRASERLQAATRIARSDTIYSRLNVGKLNLYKLFAERAFQLVKPAGLVGMLMPSGIAGDQSSSGFFSAVATGGHLKALYDFENRRNRYGIQPFFPDVDTRFKFCVLVASPERKFDETHCSFFLQATEEIGDFDRAFGIAAADFALTNPNTGTAPTFRSRRDMALTTAIYARLPVLVDRSRGEPTSAWPVRYVQMINMTSDSHLFRTRVELEEREGAWNIGGNRFASPSGQWLPLYEGKMVQAFDHRAASVVVNPENLNRPAQPLPATPQQSADPAWLADPQFWVQPQEGFASASYALGFKDVTAPTNVRTMIAAIIPTGAAGNTLPLIEVDPDNSAKDPVRLTLLAANLNSIVYDFLARQKVQGQHLNWFIVEQLPVIPPEGYARAFGIKTAAEIVREAVLELTYTAHDMAPFARDMGHVDANDEILPPFGWDEARRLTLRAKLDALYFILYGVFDPTNPGASRDDVRYIYSTFSIVAQQERDKWGSYKSEELCLAWINALIAGQPDATLGL